MGWVPEGFVEGFVEGLLADVGLLGDGLGAGGDGVGELVLLF